MNDKCSFSLDSRLVSMLLGAGLILLGLLFLIGRFVGFAFDLDIGHYGWPCFIIVPGSLMFVTSFAAERKTGLPLAIMGAMVTMTGAILLFQNTFDLYATWAYAWALIAPTSIGLAQMVYGALRGMEDEVRSGFSLAGTGLVIFLIAGFFFEMVIGVSGFHLAGIWLFWPLLLIGLGAVVLLSNFRLRREQPEA